MKITTILLVSCLLFSCSAQRDTKSITLLKIELSQNLPFHTVKLRAFDPVYGSYIPIKNKTSFEKDTFLFKLDIDGPTMINLVDQNNTGAGSVFITPGDTLVMNLYWNDQSINKRIMKARWPGDNLMYQSIRNGYREFWNKIKKTKRRFLSRKEMSNHVDDIFAAEVGPGIKKYSGLKMSSVYYAQVFIPFLELGKATAKNELIKNEMSEAHWKRFYVDEVFKNPQYKFWNYDFAYFEFEDYLYTAINKGDIRDLNLFIANIENFYRKEDDTLQTKIAISRGLVKYLEEIKKLRLSGSIFQVFDSICKTYNLDIRKFNLPTPNKESAYELQSDILHQIKLVQQESKKVMPLDNVIVDTNEVYYIDYWASWCKPCIEGLPYTIELDNRKIPGLKILYFSIDENEKAFYHSSARLKLPGSRSYNVIIDDKNMDRYKQLNPSISIPSYQLVFYENGTWKVSNASSSRDIKVSEIENLITR